MPLPLPNARFDILGICHDRVGGATPFEVFQAKYRTSKQPLKKVRGLERHMRRMVRDGLLRLVPSSGRYVLTPEGLAAGRRQQAEAERRWRPQFPRLAN